jgi:hypothetical protein
MRRIDEAPEERDRDRLDPAASNWSIGAQALSRLSSSSAAPFQSTRSLTSRICARGMIGHGF